MINSTSPKPPGELRRSGRALWRSVTTHFELEPHELQILAEACATADVIADLRAVVDAEGVTNESPQGVRAHPAVVELRQQRIVLARLITVLRIPVDADKAAGRTPAAPGIRGVYTFGGAS